MSESKISQPANLLRRFRTMTSWLAWSYLALILASWFLLLQGDTSWFPTVWLFAPRGILLLPPLALLVPWTLLVRPKSIILHGISAILIVGPIMGFCIPWHLWLSKIPPGDSIRVLTCNMHFTRGDTGPLERLIETCQPDIIAIQEWPVSARSKLNNQAGWFIHPGTRLFLASRFPILKTTELGKHSMSDNGSAQIYELETPQGKINLISLHLASIRRGINHILHKNSGATEEIEANDALRHQQSEFIAEHAEKIQTPLILVGDFNTPPQSVIFRKVWQPYQDAFSEAGLGWGYTFQGSRTMVRIDHILASKHWFCKSARVETPVGSLHRPVIADLIRPGVD